MAESTLDASLTTIPRDAMVLIHGPPMTGKYELLLQTLTHSFDAIIVISTKNQAPRVISDYHAFAGTVDPDRIGIVDATSHFELFEPIEETQRVKFASSPDNLTEIGVKFTELFELFQNFDLDDPHVGVGLHALSHLVMYSGVKSVYKFLQVLTGQLRTAGWFGVAVLDESADTEQIETLHQHFDGSLETRENQNGIRECRLKGFNGLSEWTAF